MSISTNLRDDDSEVLFALEMALEHDQRHKALALETWMPRIREWFLKLDEIDAGAKRMITMSNGKPDKRIPGTLTYNCDEADMQLLEALADASGVSKTAVIRSAVRLLSKLNDKRIFIEENGQRVEIQIIV